jgi:hypothetical protein
VHGNGRTDLGQETWTVRRAILELHGAALRVPGYGRSRIAEVKRSNSFRLLFSSVRFRPAFPTRGGRWASAFLTCGGGGPKGRMGVGIGRGHVPPHPPFGRLAMEPPSHQPRDDGSCQCA